MRAQRKGWESRLHEHSGMLRERESLKRFNQGISVRTLAFSPEHLGSNNIRDESKTEATRPRQELGGKEEYKMTPEF